jgi:RNA ligase (TIGR02306 family)
MTEFRKLVQIKTIDRIDENPKADSLETAVVGGWKIVVRKGEFAVGEKVIYFEIDSALPTSVPEFAFLAPRSEKSVLNPENKYVDVHILKTAKLRGQVSQGLLLPLGFGLTGDSTPEEVSETFKNLGVFKYEPPLPGGSVQVGSFPTKIARKTDSERVQNLTNEFLQSLDTSGWLPRRSTVPRLPSGSWTVCFTLPAATGSSRSTVVTRTPRSFVSTTSTS